MDGSCSNKRQLNETELGALLAGMVRHMKHHIRTLELSWSSQHVVRAFDVAFGHLVPLMPLLHDLLREASLLLFGHYIRYIRGQPSALPSTHTHTLTRTHAHTGSSERNPCPFPQCLVMLAQCHQPILHLLFTYTNTYTSAAQVGRYVHVPIIAQFRCTAQLVGMRCRLS